MAQSRNESFRSYGWRYFCKKWHGSIVLRLEGDSREGLLNCSLFAAAISLAPAANNAQGANDSTVLMLHFRGTPTPRATAERLADANAACGDCLTPVLYSAYVQIRDPRRFSYTYVQAHDHNGTLSYDGGSTFTGGFLVAPQVDPNWFVFDLTALGRGRKLRILC